MRSPVPLRQERLDRGLERGPLDGLASHPRPDLAPTLEEEQGGAARHAELRGELAVPLAEHLEEPHPALELLRDGLELRRERLAGRALRREEVEDDRLA